MDFTCGHRASSDGVAEINVLQVSASRAVATGDFAVTADQLPRLLSALAANGVTATAVHHHLIGESRGSTSSTSGAMHRCPVCSMPWAQPWMPPGFHEARSCHASTTRNTGGQRKSSTTVVAELDLEPIGTAEWEPATPSCLPRNCHEQRHRQTTSLAVTGAQGSLTATAGGDDLGLRGSAIYPQPLWAGLSAPGAVVGAVGIGPRA